MLSFFKLLRPNQYIKNSFVFLGVIFAERWDTPQCVAASIVFLAFCAMASAVYIINDIFDVDADRQHPFKKNRPLASGAVSKTAAIATSFSLALLGLALALFVSVPACMFIVVYALLNLAYSWRWKRIAVLDVFIISAGFMLRILAGTIGVGIVASTWLLLCGLMLTLFLGFAKRRAELLLLENSATTDKVQTRRALDEYTPMMIEQFMSISAACTILSYSLYTLSPDTIERHGTDALIYTVPFVVYGVFRYIFLLHKQGKGHDTANDLYTDPQLCVTAIAWIAATIVILA